VEQKTRQAAHGSVLKEVSNDIPKDRRHPLCAGVPHRVLVLGVSSTSERTMSIIYMVAGGCGAMWIGTAHTAANFTLVEGTESIWLVPGTF
jgi:hypothetical protein